MDRLRKVLRTWRERPEVGAGAAFLSLQTKKGSSKFAERIFGNASWLLIVSVVLVTLLSLRNEASLEVTHISVLLGFYFIYVLALEATSRALRDYYDATLFRIGRIAVNIVTVSALVWFSSGVGSYFWFFYSLPVLQALVYFGIIGALMVSAGVFSAYWTVSVIATILLGQSPDYALLTMNSLVLSIVSFALYWLFRAARESRKVEHFEALLAVQKIPLALDTATGLDDILEKVIKAAARAVEASSGSLMLLDKQTNTLKIRARYPLIRPWWKEDREFKLGEGIAGWVAQHKEPYLCPDAAKDPRFIPADPEGSIKSLLAVPIVSHGRSLGVISVDSTKTGGFDENDTQLLLAFASYIGDRIEKAKLLDTLYALGRSTSLDLPEALQIVLEQLETIVGYDSAAIFLIEEGRAKAVAARGFPDVQKARKVSFAPAEDALFQEMSRTKRPLVIPDVRKDKRFRALGDTGYVRSWLGAPLVAGGKVIGFLTLDSRNVGHFNQVDAEFVSVFASHAAIAIEGARFHERQQRWTEELEALQQTGLDITAQLDREPLLQTIIQRAVELLRAKGGGIYGYDPAQDELTVAADWGGKRSIVGHTLKVGEGMAGRVVQTGEPLVVDDYGTWPGRAPIYEPDLFRAVVEVPLQWENRILGVLYVTDDVEDRVFTQQDADLLGLLASQAAIAMENARLLREVRQQANELELLLDVNATVASGQSLEECLQRLAEKVVRLLPTTFVYVALLEQDGKALITYAAHPIRDGLQWNRKVSQSYPLSASPSDARAIEMAEPLVLSTDVPDDQEVLAKTEQRLELGEKLQSACLIPLRSVNGDPFGVLCLGEVRRRERVSFDSQRVRLCKAIADQVAVIIEKAQLFEQTYRRASDLAALHQMSLDIVKYQQVLELTKSILGRAVDLLGVKGGGLYLLDESNEKVKLVAVSNLPGHFVGMTLEVGNSVVGRVIKRQTALAVSDYRNWPDRLRQYDEYGFTAVAGAPIVWEDKTLGAIAVHTDVEGHVFTPEDLDLLSHLGNLAAVALENVRQMDGFERLMASAIDAIIVVDEEGRVIKFNEQAERILRYKREEVLEQLVGPLYYDEKEAKRVKRLLIDSKDGRITDYDTFVRSKDGELIPIRLSASLLFDYEGKRAGSVGFFRDLREIESAKRQIQQLNSLLAAGQAITAQLDLATVLESIATNAMKALSDVDAIVLYSYDPHKGEFHVPPVTKGVMQRKFILGPLNPNSVVARLMEIGRPYFADDAEADPVMAGDFVARESIVSSAGVPLKAGDRIVGIMFFNYRKPHPFSEEEKIVFSILANQAAIAIQNARLYEETPHRLEELTLLRRIAMAASSATDIDEVLQVTTDTIAEFLEYESVGIRLTDEMGQLTGPTYYAGFQPQSLNFSRDRGIVGRVVREGKPTLVPDVSKDADYVPSYPDTKSEMCMPLRIGERVIGVINVESTELDAFKDHDLRLMETIASSVVNWIENARLYTQLEKMRERLAARTALVEFAHAKTTWMHGIESKATALIGEIEMLVSLHKNDPATLERLSQMRQLLKELEDIPQVTPVGVEEKAESIPLRRLILEILSREIREKPSIAARISLVEQLKIPDAVTVRAVRRWLIEAFENVIHNSLAVMQERGTLKVIGQCIGHIVDIKFIDSGPGFPQSVQQYLFKSIVPKEKGAKGMGLGLWWTAIIVKDTGGDIGWERDESAGETAIVIRLPIER